MPQSNPLDLQNAPLGKKSSYRDTYAPELLFPIPRQNKRAEMGISSSLPFTGNDIWNAFELSWLNAKGKPIVATAQFIFPCESPNLIESKSLKLYLNSFNNSSYDSAAQIKTILTQDLSQAAGAPVTVDLFVPEQFYQQPIADLEGQCLDNLDISCDTYLITPDYLTTLNEQIIEETLYSHLLKSNCLVTGQPDWGSVQIHYRGKTIDHAGLLKYIISFRNHNEFGEPCVERIFIDIMERCAPEYLVVQARYTRRGGLDINPIRSTTKIMPVKNIRTFRQ